MGFAAQDAQQEYYNEVQNVAQEFQTTAHQAQPAHSEEDPAHTFIHSAMSIFGSGTVMLALFLGGIVLYKKFVKQWFAK